MRIVQMFGQVCGVLLWMEMALVSSADIGLRITDNPEPGRTWRGEIGGFEGISDIDALADGSAVAVHDGLIAYRDGKWAVVNYADETRLTAVDMVDALRGWAAGVRNAPGGSREGVILEVRGDDLRVSLRVAQEVWWTGLKALAPDDVWAVGTGGQSELIYHFDGHSWQRLSVEPGLRGWPVDIDMVSESSGYVTLWSGIVLRWDGAEWKKMEPALTLSRPFEIRAMAVVSEHDMWAVGGVSAGVLTRGQQLVAHFDGVAWKTVVERYGPPLHSIDMVSSQIGWATGQGGAIYEFSDGVWTYRGSTLPYGSSDFSALYTVEVIPGVAEAWAGGGESHVVRLFVGGYTLVHPKFDARAIEMLSMRPEEGWIVGYQGILFTFDGTRWVESSRVAGLPPLTDVCAYSTHDIWAVGDEAIVHGDGSSWRVVATLPSVYMTGVACGGGGEVWAVGVRELADAATYESKIYSYDGLSWVERAQIDAARVNAIVAPTVGSVWVGGTAYLPSRRALLQRFDGARWTTVAIEGREVEALAMRESGVGWAAVDRNGQRAILRLAFGSVSDAFPIEPNSMVGGLAMTADNNGWAVGADGLILRFDGVAWVKERPIGKPIGSGAPLMLEDIVAVAGPDGSEAVWAVGRGSSVIRRAETAPYPTATRGRLPGDPTATPGIAPTPLTWSAVLPIVGTGTSAVSP